MNSFKIIRDENGSIKILVNGVRVGVMWFDRFDNSGY